MLRTMVSSMAGPKHLCCWNISFAPCLLNSGCGHEKKALLNWAILEKENMWVGVKKQLLNITEDIWKYEFIEIFEIFTYNISIVYQNQHSLENAVQTCWKPFVLQLPGDKGGSQCVAPQLHHPRGNATSRWGQTCKRWKKEENRWMFFTASSMKMISLDLDAHYVLLYFR